MKIRPLDCHDCHAREGEIHHYGCDMERCPFCGNQLITCDCCYNLLRIDCFPGTWAYKNGLTKEQEKQWLRMLKRQGRIPHVVTPSSCARCGELWPEFFHVPNEEWNKFVVPALQGKILCRDCYDNFKLLFPDGWKAVNYRKKFVPKELVKVDGAA